MKRVLQFMVLAGILLISVVAVAQTEMASAQTPRVGDVSRTSQIIGVDLTRTAEHFYLYKNGGAIDLAAKNIDDVGSIAAIRRYLEKQEKAFAKGDIELQRQLYSPIPQSLMTIRKLRDQISFSYTATDEGGALRMFTINQEARQAIHDYLKLEIDNNQTGDPKSVQD